MIRAHLAWLADDAGVSLEALEDALPDAERETLALLRLPARRRGFLLSRTLLRRLVPGITGTTAAALAFDRTGNGRLRLIAPSGWHVSLSHADSLVAVAVANAACGIDIERPRPTRPLALAARYFAPAERAWLEAQPHALRHDAFFRLWTLKEAAVKALGAGLAGHLDRLAFLPDGHTPRPLFDTPALVAWQGSAGPARLAAVVAGTGPVAWSCAEVTLADLLRAP